MPKNTVRCICVKVYFLDNEFIVHGLSYELCCVARLKDDFDSQIQRLVLKLSLEQQARAEVEQRIDNVSVRERSFLLFIVKL